MIFKPLYLYGNQQTGSDVLGNPIYDLVPIGVAEGRFSSWTAEEISLDNREVTVNNRKIVTRAPKAHLEAASKVQFEDKYYSITEIIGDDTTRWRILVVNRYGSESL